jgi:hypothetical protein
MGRTKKHKPIFIIKASNDEKDWEWKITMFAWITIIAWIIVAVVTSIAINYYNLLQAEKIISTQANDEMTVWHNAYDKCIYEKEHMPILNGMEVTITPGGCNGKN